MLLPTQHNFINSILLVIIILLDATFPHINFLYVILKAWTLGTFQEVFKESLFNILADKMTPPNCRAFMTAEPS